MRAGSAIAISVRCRGSGLLQQTSERRVRCAGRPPDKQRVMMMTMTMMMAPMMLVPGVCAPSDRFHGPGSVVVVVVGVVRKLFSRILSCIVVHAHAHSPRAYGAHSEVIYRARQNCCVYSVRRFCRSLGCLVCSAAGVPQLGWPECGTSSGVFGLMNVLACTRSKVAIYYRKMNRDAIASYTFWPSIRQGMDTESKKLSWF